MKDFISTIGDIDYQKVTLDYGEKYRQVRLDRGNTAAIVTKKLKHLKRLFQLAVIHRQFVTVKIRSLFKIGLKDLFPVNSKVE